MVTIRVELSPDLWGSLQAEAARLGLPPEELARRGIEEIVAPRRAEFLCAAERVLAKNDELYRRLAQ